MYARRWPAVIVTVILAGIAPAQAQGGVCAGCSVDTGSHFRVHPAVGVRFGAPARASAALGLVAGGERRGNPRSHSTEFTLFVEPGWSAGRASIGAVRMFGNLGSGLGVNATVLRTWKDPPWLRNNRTYVGGEIVGWPVFFLGPRVGIFREVRGAPQSGWFVTADFGYGY